jgi:hypothetical protein
MVEARTLLAVAKARTKEKRALKNCIADRRVVGRGLAVMKKKLPGELGNGRERWAAFL